MESGSLGKGEARFHFFKKTMKIDIKNFTENIGKSVSVEIINKIATVSHPHDNIIVGMNEKFFYFYSREDEIHWHYEYDSDTNVTVSVNVEDDSKVIDLERIFDDYYNAYTKVINFPHGGTENTSYINTMTKGKFIEVVERLIGLDRYAKNFTKSVFKPKKLIRELIKEFLKEDEYEYITDQKELNELYAKKIREELSEVQDSEHKVISEFCDLIEVAICFAKVNGFSNNEIQDAYKEKSENKGTFYNLALTNPNPENPSNALYFGNIPEKESKVESKTELRYQQRDEFREKFGLTDERYKRLHELWMIFGNNGEKHTNGGHYFIQEIVEHNFVDWESWCRKFHKDLVGIIITEFPELTITFKDLAQK